MKRMLAGGVHKLWHRYLKEAGSLSGILRMRRAERMAEQLPDHFMVTKVDDDLHMGARLLLHVHAELRQPGFFDPNSEPEPYWHGVTVELLTQGGSDEPPRFFLYPQHLDELVEKLQRLRREMNKHPNVRREKRMERRIKAEIRKEERDGSQRR